MLRPEKSITFCFPYRGFGGVPMQFLRLSSILADRGWSVRLVDFEDGAMAKNLSDARVGLIRYSGEAPAAVPSESVLVLQTMTPWSIFPGLEVEAPTRVLFWTCHPFNLVPTVPIIGLVIQSGAQLGSFVIRVLLPAQYSMLKRFLRELLVKKAIVFMDVGTAKNTGAYLKEEISDPVFVPIPAPQLRDSSVKAGRIDGAPLRIAWVGRVADFKYPVLLYTLGRLNRLAAEFNGSIIVDVVGDGNYLDLLKTDAVGWKNIRVRFVGVKPPGDVLKFIGSDVDLLFAMGTSALEGAALGVPTVLLDFSYGAIPCNYRFRWLHERSGYSLGELIGPEHLEPGDDGLLGILSESISNHERLRTQAKEYVRRNHSMEIVADRFEKALGETRLTWGDLIVQGFLKPGAVYRCYKYLQCKLGR